MPTKVDYINELERRHGSSPELDEMRGRYAPEPNLYEGMVDQKQIADVSKEIFSLSIDTSLPTFAIERIYPFAKEVNLLGDFKNEIKRATGEDVPWVPINFNVPNETISGQERPGLIKRGLKKFGRGFVDVFASIRTRSQFGQMMTELNVLNERMQEAKDSGIIPKDATLKQFLAISDKDVDELFGGETLQEHIKRRRTERVVSTAGFAATEVPAAETIPETIADVAGNIASFITKLAVAKKALGPPAAGRSLVAWETINLANGGTPGAGAAMYAALRGIDKIPIEGAKGFFVKTSTQSGLFAGVTAAKGADTEAIVTAAALPWALRAFDAAAKGTVRLGRAKLEAKAIKNLRQIGKDNGIDFEKVPDSTLKFLISKSRQAKFWNKQFDKGKIPEQTLNQKLNNIRADVEPALQAIAKQQPVATEAPGKPSVEPAIKLVEPTVKPAEVKPVEPIVKVKPIKPVVTKPVPTKPLAQPVTEGKVTLVKPEDELITLGVPSQTRPLPGGRQAGATTIIPDIATELTETSKRLGSNLAGIVKSTREIFDRNVLRYSDRLKKLGGRGKQVSKDFDEITQRTQKRVNNSVLDAKEALKGVSKENREKIAKAMNKRLKKVPKWIQQRADKLTSVLDKMMNEARAVGIQRRVDGEKVEIRGSGKAFPQIPNAQGDKILKQAGSKGLSSPSVLAVANEAVELGLADSVEKYVAQLQQFRNDQLRGVSSYLERTRFELPERFIEWDPDRVLDALIQRTWLTIEGTRQWGTDKGGLSFPKLAVQIEGIRDAHGPDEAKLLEQFSKAAFGQELLSTEASRKISGFVRGYQFLVKIAGSPFTITRNMLDRFNKARSFAPLSVVLKTIKDYPPFINQFLKHSREIEEEMIRRGAVFSNTAIGEGYQPGHLATKIAGKAFASSELGNQVFIGQAKKNAINHNLRLLQTNPKIAAVFNKRIGGLLSPLEAIGRAPTQAQARLRELGDDKLLSKLESVDDITPDLLDAVLHKTVRDKAFPVVLSTKRSWWDNKPFLRMVTQFKIWGTDQVGHVWNDVVKDTVQNRDPSKMIGWLVTMAVTGEIYNIMRDFVLGRDESLLATLSDKERRNLKEISTTILKDMLDGGAVGILLDVIYGLPNLIGGPTLQTVKNLGEAIVKSVWNPSQAKDAIGQMAKKETPALKQAQGLLDKIDAKFEEKNITQDYYKVRQDGFEWFYNKKFPTASDKAKRFAVQAILGWVKNAPQERTLSYEMAIRQIIVGDTEDASEHLFFLLKTARDDEELLSIEKGITSALNNASPLGKVADKDLGEFFRKMSTEKRRMANSTQLRYDRNSAEAHGSAVRKYEKWRRENR